MALSFEIQNQRVQQWASDTDRVIQGVGTSYGITHRSGSPSAGSSLPKVRSRMLYRDGSVSAVAFRFPRTLIYPHTGAGKGMGGRKGSRWTTKEGVSKRTNPKSLGKAGSGNRQAKPFLKDALDRQVPVLADIVAKTSADIITQNLFV